MMLISGRRLTARQFCSAVLAAAALVSLALAPALARADGDPASDVLASQTAFVPADAGASTVQLAGIGAVLAGATRSSYAIRVAIIPSATDLGSVTALWRQPGNYARFLGAELSLVSDARVLVVMPNGFGLYHAGRRLPAEEAALARLRPTVPGPGLVSAAITAIEQLAAASGDPLSPASLAAVARAVSNPGGRSGSGSGSGVDSTTSLVVFAAGLALIALAWGASLRARPLSLSRRQTHT
jgi:hypothetical protein